jgi:hypothetical protein
MARYRYAPRRVRPVPLFLLALTTGCETLPPPVPPPVAPPEPVVVEALLGLTPGRPLTSPEAPPAHPPSLADVVTTLRSPAVLRALAEETALPVNDRSADAVSVDAQEDGPAVRLQIRARARSAALFTCRTWQKLGETHDRRADPTEAWLTAEVARLEHEIAALDRGLALLPVLPEPSPLIRDVVLTNARVLALTIAARSSTPSPDALTESLPLVRALVRLSQETQIELALSRARGLGEAHPEVRTLASRAAWLTARRAAQLQAEGQAAQSVVETMQALPARADRQAVARALAARLRGVGVGQVSSLDPLPLQLLVLEHLLLAAEDAELAVRYGKNHPQRQVLAARLDALAADLAVERDHLAAQLDASLPLAAPDPRPAALRDRAAALASVLARLVHDREVYPPSRWAVITPCHAL